MCFCIVYERKYTKTSEHYKYKALTTKVLNHLRYIFQKSGERLWLSALYCISHIWFVKKLWLTCRWGRGRRCGSTRFHPVASSSSSWAIWFDIVFPTACPLVRLQQPTINPWSRFHLNGRKEIDFLKLFVLFQYRNVWMIEKKVF